MVSYIYSILIISLGFLLILADILLIPGGFVGTVGGILILITIYLDFTHYGSNFAINISLLTVFFSIILTWVTFKYKLWTWMEHKKSEKKEDGFLSFTTDFSNLIGENGSTITPLRPVGAIIINNKKYDCISQGEMIESNVQIVVISVSNGQLVVKKI